MLRLIDQGKLRLYDVVAQFDREFAKMKVLGTDGSIMPAQRLITVEDLLMHRAGFSYEFILGCHVAPFTGRQIFWWMAIGHWAI